MDCAQHVLSILDLEITNQMPVSRSRDPALTNQRPVIRFWLRQELKKSQCSFVRPVLVCLKLSIFILEQSGSVYGQAQVRLRSGSGQAQVRPRSGSGQAQVRHRSGSGQAQVRLRSGSGLEALLTHFVVQSEPKILRLVSLRAHWRFF